MEEELWRPVVGWPAYLVSNLGRVRRVGGINGRRERLRKLTVASTGYLTVRLSDGPRRKSALVHRLVCEAFHGPAPEGLQVAHMNGVRSDPRASNLRWSTPSENQADRNLHGTDHRGDKHYARTTPTLVLRGECHGQSKLTAAQVRAIRSDPRLNIDIAQQYGVSFSTVGRIKSRKIWAHIA